MERGRASLLVTFVRGIIGGEGSTASTRVTTLPRMTGIMTAVGRLSIWLLLFIRMSIFCFDNFVLWGLGRDVLFLFVCRASCRRCAVGTSVFGGKIREVYLAGAAIGVRWVLVLALAPQALVPR